MFNEKTVRRLKWGIVLVCMVATILMLPNRVYAYGISFQVLFDKTAYSIGSYGTATLSITSTDQPSQISLAGFTLYFVKTDGSLYESDFFGTNYGNSPLYAPQGTAQVQISFQIPTDQDIVSGYLYLLLNVYYREYGTVQYRQTQGTLSNAYSGGQRCMLNNPSLPTYSSMKANYDSLKSSNDYANSRLNSLQNQLSTYQFLMFVFAVTTLGLIAATIFFATRRQKVKTV